MTHKRIDFFSEVLIKDNAKNPQYRGRKGVVMGISEEDGTIYDYFVHLYDEEYSCHIEKYELEPTGKKFKREDFYNGSSIGVTPDGEITRVDIKPE